MFTGPLMITRCWCAWTGTASCWCGARPARPGAPLAYYHEYQRNGVSNLIMLLAPLEGLPRVGVRDRRTRTGWAEVVRKLVDEDYPGRERIVLGMANLNTHHPSSLCEAFEPAETLRIAQWLEIHYRPKHGSWMNPVLSWSKGWRGWNWECWPSSAWTAGYLIGKSRPRKPGLGSSGATGTESGWTGALPPRTPESSSSPYVHQFNRAGPIA